jgi:hypothetical protein
LMISPVNHDWGVILYLPNNKGIPNNKPQLGMVSYWLYLYHIIEIIDSLIC